MVSGGADHSFWWFQGALIIRAALAYTAFSFDLCTQPPWRWITPDSVLHMMQTWQPHLSPYSETSAHPEPDHEITRPVSLRLYPAGAVRGVARHVPVSQKTRYYNACSASCIGNPCSSLWSTLTPRCMRWRIKKYYSSIRRKGPWRIAEIGIHFASRHGLLAAACWRPGASYYPRASASCRPRRSASYFHPLTICSLYYDRTDALFREQLGAPVRSRRQMLQDARTPFAIWPWPDCCPWCTAACG